MEQRLLADSKMGDVPLVGVTRAGILENLHRGRFCVVSAEDGSILASSGDVEALTYVRSTGKPLQAIASLLGGVEEKLGWGDRHLALMAASHRGYPGQIEALAEMLSSSGVPEEALVFRAGKPIASEPRDAWAREGGQPRKLFHTCAGKHLAMMAWSRLEGWPLEGYAEPDHPSQREILRRVLAWTDTEETECRIGRDGCGLPVAAIPMRRIALGYARLACPDAAPGDRGAAEAANRIARAMNRHPDLVEGPGRLASLLLADPNVVAKSGAQGLFAVGLRRERLGIAVHLSDGTETAWAYVVLSLLERYGGVAAETAARIRERFPAELRNDADALAGRWETLI
ncbi:asparaginase [Cohnella sp. CFH 77786]|uniref:asparaginase n=1 Tax=Cohnella sp. CFH 77786 TaxID=2662265 RepID=UPI001C60BF3E|nr:asparaginase [Cohnella sp. CFH 77786]